MNTEQYFNAIKKGVAEQYELAGRAKVAGIDPVSSVETPIATTLAEKSVGLISVVYPQMGTNIVERIHELEKNFGGQDWRVAFVLALEVAKEKFCKFKESKEAIEVGMRAGLAYITNGVVASPLEGFTRLGIKKRKLRISFYDT